MKIYYDNIIFQLQKAGGISTYWTELIAHALRDNVDINFIDSPNENLSAQKLNLNGRIVENIGSPLILNRFKSIHLDKVKSDFIFHSSYNRISPNKHAKNVVTIHDFVHEKFYGGVRKFLHSTQKTNALNIAEKIIAVSENTKADLLKMHPKIAPAKVEVIYNGVSEDFYRLDSIKHNGKPFLLFIGSREHYKNFDFSIKLVKELPDFELYVVGQPFTKKEEQLITKTIPGRFKVLSNIDDRELNILYNQAFALLYPSSYEGFGIPILEAMKAGLPFIALNKSSIPEVAGDAGILVDELDIEAFKQAINNIANERDIYVAKGLERAKLFSWDKCYRQTMELYSKLIKA